MSAAVSSLRRRLLSGSAWAFGGKAGTALAMLGSNALLARLLSPEDLGAYFLAFSVVSFGSLLGSLGLGKVVVRLVAESVGLGQFRQARRVVTIVSVLGLAGAVCVGVAYLLLGQAVGGGVFGSPALASAAGLIAGWIAAVSLQRVLAEAFRGFHDIRLAVALEGGLGLMTGLLLVVCLGLLWALEGQATLGTVVLLAAVSAFASVLAAGWLLRRKVASLSALGEAEDRSAQRVGAVLRVAWPMLVTDLTLFALTQADLWIVGAARPQDEVAVYGAAAKLVILISMPLMIANSVVPPMIAEMYVQGRKRELQRALRAIATLAGLPAVVVLVAFVALGGPILELVFGDYYREGATILALLSLGQLANVWAGSCGQTLTMTGHHVMMMVITVVCGVATVVLGLALVGEYGATSVALVAASGLVLQNILMWLGTRFATGLWTHVGFKELSKLARTAFG